jgi:hypothetical protein
MADIDSRRATAGRNDDRVVASAGNNRAQATREAEVIGRRRGQERLNGAGLERSAAAARQRDGHIATARGDRNAIPQSRQIQDIARTTRQFGAQIQCHRRAKGRGGYSDAVACPAPTQRVDGIETRARTSDRHRHPGQGDAARRRGCETHDGRGG